MVQGIQHLTYDEQLENLGLSMLDKRRNHSNLIETLKILNEIYDIGNSLDKLRHTRSVAYRSDYDHRSVIVTREIKITDR